MCRYFVILGTFLHIKVPTIHLQLQHGMVVLTPGTSGDSMGDPVGPKPYWGDPKAGVSRGFVLSEEYLYLIHNPDRVAYQGWYLGQMMVRHQAHMESHGILKPTSHTILYWNYTLQNHTYHILVFSLGCPCSPWFSPNMTNLGWLWGPLSHHPRHWRRAMWTSSPCWDRFTTIYSRWVGSSQGGLSHTDIRIFVCIYIYMVEWRIYMYIYI